MSLSSFFNGPLPVFRRPIRVLVLCLLLTGLVPANAQENLKLLEELGRDTNQKSTTEVFNASSVDRAVSANVKDHARPEQGGLSILIWGLAVCLAGGALAVGVGYWLKRRGRRTSPADLIQVKDVKRGATKRRAKSDGTSSGSSPPNESPASRPARPAKDPFPSDIYTEAGDRGKIPPRRRT